MSNTVITLNLINNSNDQNNTRYVIFQKNVATSYQETTTMAWRVIKNLGMGDNHPFTFYSRIQRPSSSAEVEADLEHEGIFPQPDEEEGVAVTPVVLTEDQIRQALAHLDLTGLASADVLIKVEVEGNEARPTEVTLVNEQYH